MEKKFPHDPTPQFPKLADLHWILPISLCNGAGTSKFYVLAFVPVWGCFLLDFSYDFMNTAIFPTPCPNPKPPTPQKTQKVQKVWENMEFSSKITCCQLLADFLG